MKTNPPKEFRLHWRTGIPLFNRCASLLQRHSRHQYRLDAGELLQDAERDTELGDWGVPDVEEPLSRIVRGYENSGLVTAFGRYVLRDRLGNLLRNRLKIINALHQNPDIRKQRISRPLFVVGLPRSGTTLLYNLLSLDESARALKVWEAFNPVDATEPPWLEKKTHNLLSDWLLPGLPDIHPRSPLDTEECTWLLANTFYAPGTFSLFGDANEYEDWLDETPFETNVEAYELYKQQLQILQLGDQSRRWVLKSPAHVSRLDVLLEVFPDARIVLPVREMEQVLPSAASLFGTVRSLTNNPMPLEQMGVDVLRVCRGQRAALQALRRHPDQILPVSFHDLVSDKIQALKHIYDWAGFEFSPRLESAIQTFSARDRHSPGKHRYSLEQFGLSTQKIQDECASVMWRKIMEQASRN